MNNPSPGWYKTIANKPSSTLGPKSVLFADDTNIQINICHVKIYHRKCKCVRWLILKNGKLCTSTEHITLYGIWWWQVLLFISVVVCVCVCVYIYTHMYVYIYIYIYVYIYIYTHTYIQGIFKKFPHFYIFAENGEDGRSSNWSYLRVSCD
jgi:hypothetical protein